MKFEDIVIGKRYIDEYGDLHMVLDKNADRGHVKTITLHDDQVSWYGVKWGSFKEYDEDFYNPFEQEVQVILYRSEDHNIPGVGEFIIDHGYDVKKQVEKGECRVFKAVLKEIV